jgi:hypothetical protein
MSNYNVRDWVCRWLAVRWGKPPHSLPDPTQTQQIVAFCAENRLSGALYQILQQESSLQGSDLLRWLKLGADLLATPMQRQKAHVKQILAVFGEKNIPVLVLKSWAFYPWLYQNDPSSRPGIDLDLLIQPQNTQAAQNVLLELGYQLQSGEPWPGFLQRYAYTSVYTQPGWIPIGLHTGLLPIGKQQANMIPTIFQQAQILLAEENLRTLSQEDTILYLSGHLALHHQYHPALFRYYDLVLLLQIGSPTDWEKVFAQAQTWNLTLSLRQTLHKVEELWPGSIPESIFERINTLSVSPTEYRLHHWAAERPHNPFSALIVSLLNQSNWQTRLRYLSEIAIPSPDYMRKRYEREKNRRSLLYLYFIRWKRALKSGIEAIYTKKRKSQGFLKVER